MVAEQLRLRNQCENCPAFVSNDSEISRGEREKAVSEIVFKWVVRHPCGTPFPPTTGERLGVGADFTLGSLTLTLGSSKVGVSLGC